MTTYPSSKPLEFSEWCRTEALTGDASPRRYSRLWRPDGQTAILVEYPAPVRSLLEGDLDVLSWCRRRGLRVPTILAWDRQTGRAVLSDLGGEDAEALLERTPVDDRRGLVEEMLQPLEVLAGCEIADLPPWNPPLDRVRLRWELAGFELWFVRHYRSHDPSASLARWLDELATEVGSHPLRVCHRDYHLNNLLIDEEGSVGVIDIQDILVGPDTYDAVSLTAERAATSLLSLAQRQAVLASWAHRTRAESGWLERSAAVRIQRSLKVLGTFARFHAAGRTEYHQWMIDLARDLIEPLKRRGAEADLAALLKG
jgi:N-acetylmuramate 1-kinase